MKYILCLISFITCSWSHAQVKVTGKILHYTTQKTLALSQINVTDLNTSERFSLVSSNGKYKLKLEPSTKYKLEYTKQGFYSKHLIIDTKGIPTGKQAAMYIDMDMVEKSKKLEEGTFQKAMGKAMYDPDVRQMIWDLEYSKLRFQEVNKAFKEEAQGTKREDETVQHDQLMEEFLEPQNPFRLTRQIRSDVPPGSFSVNPSAVQFKNQLQAGMVFGNLALGADDQGTDQRIGMVKQLDALNASKEHPFSSKAYQTRLANSAGVSDSLDAILSEMYFHYRDKVQVPPPSNAYLLELGAWIEVTFQTCRKYNEEPSKELNHFIGNAKKDLEIVIKRSGVNASDAELSLFSDLEKLLETFNKIWFKVGGEMITSENVERPQYFNITPEILEELNTSLTAIRSKLL